MHESAAIIDRPNLNVNPYMFTRLNFHLSFLIKGLKNGKQFLTEIAFFEKRFVLL
jgi:hypothetical protein